MPRNNGKVRKAERCESARARRVDRAEREEECGNNTDHDSIYVKPNGKVVCRNCGKNYGKRSDYSDAVWAAASSVFV